MNEPAKVFGIAKCTPLLFYIALSLAFFVRTLDWTGHYFGSSPDPLTFIWFLNWWPFALSHGLNPFISRYVWFPAGYNLAWATSVPFLALAAWPVTALGGPVLSFNLLTLAAPACAAWAAFLLAAELTGDRAAALAAGFLFGFSAPEYWQLLSELDLDTVFLIPLAVLLCVRRLRGRLGRAPFILGLSLVLLAQLGTSAEMLASLCLLGAVVWLLFLPFAPPAARAGLWRLAADIALAAPLVLLLAAPFLYYMAKGHADVPPQIYPALLGSVEPLRLIFPALPLTAPGPALAAIAAQLKGFAPDTGTIIGLPLALILLLYLCRPAGYPYARPLLLATGLTILLSLGPVLHVNGRLTPVWLPWAALEHAPLLSAMLPARLMIYIALETALIAALWLAAARRPAARAARFALAGLACLFLVPTRVDLLPPLAGQATSFPAAHFAWTRWPAQPFFTPRHVREALGAAPNVLLLPNPTNGPGMGWQIEAGMTFTQAEGYVGFWPLRERKWSALTDIAAGIPQGNFRTAFPAYCAAHRVGYVLIGPGTPPALTAAIEALGWPHHMDDGVEVVATPKTLF